MTSSNEVTFEFFLPKFLWEKKFSKSSSFQFYLRTNWFKIANEFFDIEKIRAFFRENYRDVKFFNDGAEMRKKVLGYVYIYPDKRFFVGVLLQPLFGQSLFCFVKPSLCNHMSMAFDTFNVWKKSSHVHALSYYSHRIDHMHLRKR